MAARGGGGGGYFIGSGVISPDADDRSGRGRAYPEDLRAGRSPGGCANLGVDRYLDLMGLDKKVEGGRMRFILLNRVGEAVIHAEVPGPVLRETLLDCINDA